MPLPAALGIGGIILRLIQMFRNFLGNFWSAFMVFILFALPFIIEKIFVLLGVGLISFVGYGVAIEALTNWLFSSYNNISTDILSILNILGVGTGLNILVSALTVTVAYRAFVSARRLVFRKSKYLEA